MKIEKEFIISRKAELSDKVLRMLSDNPELTITELGLSGEVDLELVLQHSEFITHHIKGLGDQKINASPFFRDLVNKQSCKIAK